MLANFHAKKTRPGQIIDGRSPLKMICPINLRTLTSLKFEILPEIKK